MTRHRLLDPFQVDRSMSGITPRQDNKRHRARIWIVDDSPLQGEICRGSLAEQYEVQVYFDGTSMLEALGSSTPDLLVLDWHMPDLSGLDVCRFVRERLNAGQLPILILTATGTTESLLEAFAAGANDFVMKSFAPTEFLARVAALIHGRHLHIRLSDAEQALRTEAEFRERFIGMLAHDLRQPLNTLTFANHSLARADPKSLPPLVDIYKRVTARMATMVDELLDFTRSRPETGMPIQRVFVDFEAVASGIVEEMRMSHPDRTLNLSTDGPCSGLWDPDRLAQLCSNLIGNAIDHGLLTTPIDIQLWRNNDEAHFSVMNRGKPIPEDLLPNLFEPFQLGGRARSRAKGLGLGLHIVSEICRAHGGSVRASSDAMETVFLVSLPIGARFDTPG
jgi:two-component system sensor histidine kinase/response regulator